MRSFWGIMFGNARLVSMFNVIWVLFDIYFFTWTSRTSDYHYWKDFYMYRQIALGAAGAAMSWAFELSRLAEARLACAHEQSTGAYGQLSRVLSAMCDTVVELDSSLVVCGGPANGVTKLQSLLMTSSSVILNKPFGTFINKDDQERFRSYIDQEAESILNDELIPMQAPSLHLDLQDKYGLRLAVQLFCSALLDADGRPMYLLGIRADTDAESAAMTAMQQVQAQEEATSSHVMQSLPEASVIGCPAELHASNVNLSVAGSSRRESLGSRSSASCSSHSRSSSSDDRATGPRTVPRWAVSMSEGNLLALAASSLNKIPCDRSSCCLWHYALSQLRVGLTKLELSASACKKEWKPSDDWQCPICKSLNFEVDENCCTCCLGEKPVREKSGKKPKKKGGRNKGMKEEEGRSRKDSL